MASKLLGEAYESESDAASEVDEDQGGEEEEGVAFDDDENV